MTLDDVREEIARADSPQARLDASIRGFAEMIAAGRWDDAGVAAASTFEYANRQPSGSRSPRSFSL